MDLAAIARQFFAHVDVHGPVPAHRPELGPCHVWTGAINPRWGYGSFRRTNAQRWTFFLAEGRWPEPCALHHCDNRPCVRRDHLFEGSKKDNARDMAAKGRQWLQVAPELALGERNSNSKVTDAQRDEIRARYALGEPQGRLGREYGLSRTGVGYIVRSATLNGGT
jgi:hypothetical protein